MLSLFQEVRHWALQSPLRECWQVPRFSNTQAFPLLLFLAIKSNPTESCSKGMVITDTPQPGIFQGGVNIQCCSSSCSLQGSDHLLCHRLLSLWPGLRRKQIYYLVSDSEKSKTPVKQRSSRISWRSVNSYLMLWVSSQNSANLKETSQMSEGTALTITATQVLSPK